MLGPFRAREGDYYRCQGSKQWSVNGKVRTDWGVDRSTFRLASRVDRSHSIILEIK